MLVETRDLLTPTHAAALMAMSIRDFVALVESGELRPFVEIDGLRFYHRHEVLARKQFRDTLLGRARAPIPPRTQDLF